jgi:hypothetical protein
VYNNEFDCPRPEQTSKHSINFSDKSKFAKCTFLLKELYVLSHQRKAHITNILLAHKQIIVWQRLKEIHLKPYGN